MTSNLRSYSVRKENPTKPVTLTTAYYIGADDQYHLFPFTYVNGTLDIARIDNFQQDYIDTPAVKPDDTSCDPAHHYMLLGGTGVVTKIGPTFVSYIRAAWVLDSTSPVRIYQPCVVTKVQEMDEPDDGASIVESGFYEATVPPSSDGYIVPTFDYRTSWIFKTPLTISIVKDGVKSYITFVTLIGHDSC
jgi:hypothetical protein